MSLAAARESKQTRRSCQSCRQRKARFQYRGMVRADRDHTLCFECYRSLSEHRRARGLTDERLGTVPRSLFPRAAHSPPSSAPSGYAGASGANGVTPDV